MSKGRTSRDVAEPGKRQADDLEAFDRETESLLSGADRVIQWYAALLPKGPQASWNPVRGALAAAARRKRAKSEGTQNWAHGVRY